jgi:hypothetical protein
MNLTESLDRVLDYNETHLPPYYLYKFSLEPDLNLTISCSIKHVDEGHIIVEFSSIGFDETSTEKTKSNFTIFSTLVEIVQNHVEEYGINKVECTAFERNRLDIYEKLFERFGSDWELERGEITIIAERE